MSAELKEFLEKYFKLKPEIQDVINWLIENIDFVEKATNYKTTEEKLEENIDWASKNNDMYAKAILVYKQLKDEKKNEKN